MQSNHQAEIDLLRERVRQLEEALVPSDTKVSVEWGLTMSEAVVFVHLTTRDFATRQSIMLALYSARADEAPDEKVVDVFIHKMRKKLKPFGVEIGTVWGLGYSLADRHQYAGHS